MKHDPSSAERERVLRAEAEAIAGIPLDVAAALDAAQQAFKASGGCPGCGSELLGVHSAECPVAADDLY